VKLYSYHLSPMGGVPGVIMQAWDYHQHDHFMVRAMKQQPLTFPQFKPKELEPFEAKFRAQFGLATPIEMEVSDSFTCQVVEFRMRLVLQPRQWPQKPDLLGFAFATLADQQAYKELTAHGH
jgi:hypothetical protein